MTPGKVKGINNINELFKQYKQKINKRILKNKVNKII